MLRAVKDDCFMKVLRSIGVG